MRSMLLLTSHFEYCTAAILQAARHLAVCRGYIPCIAILAGLQRLVAVVGEIEGGSMRFAPLDIRHPLLDTTALQQQIYSHYMRMAIPELVKLVGSANLLGEDAVHECCF